MSKEGVRLTMLTPVDGADIVCKQEEAGKLVVKFPNSIKGSTHGTFFTDDELRKFTERVAETCWDYACYGMSPEFRFKEWFKRFWTEESREPTPIRGASDSEEGSK